jgi:hypothetical protein
MASREDYEAIVCINEVTADDRFQDMGHSLVGHGWLKRMKNERLGAIDGSYQ